MYLVVPQLRRRQIEIEHDSSIGWRPREASCHFNKKQDTSALTHLRGKLRVKISIKIRLKELSLYMTRIIIK